MYCFISIYTNHYLSCNVLLRSDNKMLLTYLLTYYIILIKYFIKLKATMIIEAFLHKVCY